MKSFPIEPRVQGNEVKPQQGCNNFQHKDKPQEAGDSFQQGDKRSHLSIKMAEEQTSESRVQGGQGQDIGQGDNGVACDKMLIGEDLQMKKQKNNSREVQVSSQQEGCTTPAPKRRSISGRGIGSSQRDEDGSSQWGKI